MICSPYSQHQRNQNCKDTTMMILKLTAGLAVAMLLGYLAWVFWLEGSHWGAAFLGLFSAATARATLSQ